MANKEKIVFFDFCETLVNFQTADAYVDYVREKSQSKRMARMEAIRRWLYSHHIISLLDIVKFNNYPINKRIKLFQLKGFSDVELETFAKGYYYNQVAPNIIQPILKEMQKYQMTGYKVVIVSGGYDIYLKYFAKEYGVEKVISTRIEFNSNNKCTGRFCGFDCLNQNKVILLNRTFNKQDIESKAFSDSKSDIPFLSWANEGIVISREKHQRWIEEYNFKEIIW